MQSGQGHNIFVLIPSVRGVHPMTMWNVFNMRTVAEKAGHRLHGSSVYRMPLDLARNELAAVFLSTTCDLCLMLDDDVQLEPETGLLTMVTAADAGADIVTAPCRLRDHAHGGATSLSLFNIWPTSEVVEKGDVKLLECDRTGLGAVLVKRAVLETLMTASTRYASRLLPAPAKSGDIFTSQVVAASALMQDVPEDLGVYCLDDVIFSLKARKAGLQIYAAIEVATVHDGMRGCFAEELTALDRATAAQADREKKRVAKLLDKDGKPLLNKDGKPLQ